ncbi:MAG TPA: acyl-CoA dehydrogenase family protein [Rhodanobacter sp.]|nr:acyl-CoA dehydrogenase family protein [Rhodanobacter sp.]
MDFSISDEQQMLLDTTRHLIAKDYSFARREQIRASDSGWSRETWQQMAELGLLALVIPETDGGIGAGPIGAMLVANAIGEGLLLEPFHASAILATRALVALGNDEQRAQWLPALSAGEMIAVLAHDGADGEGVSTRATPVADGWHLNGRKQTVAHGDLADLLLISAHIDGSDELALFALPADSDGLDHRGYRCVDDQRAADIELHEVFAPVASRLGGDAAAALQSALDFGLAALCAEAVGALDKILAATIEYSRTRKQFGTPIGSFQALQHRMADMLMQVEQARSMSYLASCRCGDADVGVRRHALSAAKVAIGQAARFVGQQAVQIHGGMGMTDELDVSHYFRRLTAFELRGGGTDWHLRQLARQLQTA